MELELIWNGIDLSRDTQLDEKIEKIELLIQEGSIRKVRSQINKTRMLFNNSLTQDKPSGSLAEELTRYQAMGLIDDLFTIDSFCEKLNV